MKPVCSAALWEDHPRGQSRDRRALKRIKTLFKEIARNGNEGIGNPKPLKRGFHGCWSPPGTQNLQVPSRSRYELARTFPCPERPG